jgi:hypothetical protein
MTFEERAREVCIEYELLHAGVAVGMPFGVEWLHGEIVKALRTVRRETLEEAAKVATSFLVGDPANGVPLRNPMAHEIAQAIRSLSEDKEHS